MLRTLYDDGPISRAELARRTGLTRTTVSELVGAFVEQGLAREIGPGPSTGGKQPILLELVEDSRHVIGVDLGERAFSAAIVNLRGGILREVSHPVDGYDGTAAIELVYRLVDELTATASGTLLGIGVGAPGVIDTSSGTIRWAVNLDWRDLPLGALLSERYGVPASVANDSRAAALAVSLFSTDPGGTRNLVAIKVGHGIGAGIVLGGELLHGDGHGAGEIGHIAVVDDGAQCRCGRFGCLETVASSRAIVRAANEAAERAPESTLGRLAAVNAATDGVPDLTLADVATALAEGDPEATSIVTAAGRYLGQAVAALVGILNIRRIVLLGSVTTLGEPWLAAVRDEADRRSLGLLADATTLEIDRPRGNAVVLGASALLLTGELRLGIATR